MLKRKHNRIPIEFNARFRAILFTLFITLTILFIHSAFAFSDRAIAPDKLVLQYFEHIEKGQYEELYKMLDDESQAKISKEDFIEKNANIYGGIGAGNFQVSIIDMYTSKEKPPLISFSEDADYKGRWKIVEYTVRMDTVAGEISYFNFASFKLNRQKGYRMEWYTQSIFPSLKSLYKVRVNPLKAERGIIYDRNGEMLAGPGYASAVGFVPGKMSEDPEKDILKAAELLETTPENITKKLSASYVKDDTFVQLKIISKETQELFQKLLAIPGIMISDTPVRYYPLGEKASHLTGYTQGISAEELAVLGDQGYQSSSVLGKAGLEKIYEEQLRAIDGCEIVVVDTQGEVVEVLARMDKVDGQNITLTIDSHIQSHLYDLFSRDKSCSVAMDPKTGQVLALVSTPSYDANDFVLGMSPAKWDSLNENEDLPMYNRFKAALCPGSTFKTITAAVGMDTGIVSPKDDFGPSGLRWRKDASWGGYYITTLKEYSGPANVENALVYSDNIYFGKAALKIGSDLFTEQLKAIGFEERIPFEYGLYSSIFSSTETIPSEIQLADSGYGQGQILTNPVHLAAIYTAFVNDGSILKPCLLLDEDTAPEFWKEQAFTTETADVIRNSLIQVVERGTGSEAKVHGMTLGGKTGTAEIKQSKDDNTGTELGWFVLFTADDGVETPLLVVSMVEDVKHRGGSHYVSPKVKMVFENPAQPFNELEEVYLWM